MLTMYSWGNFRGTGVRSDKVCIPKVLRSTLTSSPIWRGIAVCALGWALSGCVSSTLTPISSPPTPALSLASPDAAQTAQLDPNSVGTDIPAASTEYPEGTTVPVKRPGTENTASPPQLALAESNASASVAAGKTAALAAAKPKPPTPAIVPGQAANPVKPAK
jgi:hypothetical protein